jgi:hypothetical protein
MQYYPDFIRHIDECYDFRQKFIIQKNIYVLHDTDLIKLYSVLDTFQ